MQMLQHSIDRHSSKVYEVFRPCQDIKFGWNTHLSGSSNAIIALRVNSRIQFCGIGLFGGNIHGRALTLKVNVSNENQESLLDQISSLISNGTSLPVRFLFSNPITLEAHKKYTINANITRGQTFYGVNFNQLYCSDRDSVPFKLNFSRSSYTTDSGTYTEGQIPSLFFSKCI